MTTEDAPTEQAEQECDHLWMTEYAIHYCFSCGAKR